MFTQEFLHKVLLCFSGAMMCQINYKQYTKEASNRTAVLSRHREDHEDFPLTEYFSFKKSVLNSSRLGAKDIFNDVYNCIHVYLSSNPPVEELSDFVSQFLNGNRNRYHHKATPELIAKQKSCTFMFKFDEFLVFEDECAAEKFILNLLNRFQINISMLSISLSKFLLSLEAPSSAVIDSRPFSCFNAISSFELITTMFDVITLFKNILKYRKFGNHADVNVELDIRYVHKELSLLARKAGSGCRVYRCCRHFKQEWYCEKMKCFCELQRKRRKLTKQPTQSHKTCKNNNKTSVSTADEEDTETFLLHSALVTTVYSSPPSSPLPETPSPLNGVKMGTEDDQNIVLIDSDGDVTDREEVEILEESADQVDVVMFEKVTDMIVHSVLKDCIGDAEMTAKLGKITTALHNERHERVLLVEKYDDDLKKAADSLQNVQSENETTTTKLTDMSARLLERSKQTLKSITECNELRIRNTELERTNKELDLQITNTNSTLAQAMDRENALNERVVELEATVNAIKMYLSNH